VATVIRDDEGRLLLVQHVEGRWQLPGGAVDPGERPEEAAQREAREEAGIEIEVTGIAGVFGGPEYEITYGNGDRTGWVVTVYDARIVSGAPAPSDDETQDVGWFTPAEIETFDLHPATRRTLEILFRPS